MILTDREIEAALANKQILIDPAPDAEAYSSTSLDLTLSAKIRVWHDFDTLGVEPPVVTPGIAGYKANPVITKHTDLVEIPDDGYIVKPGSFFLAWTAEKVTLPSQFQLAARVEGKSSLARLGIGVHVTAPTIHAGFTGQITLEMYNLGNLKVKLHTGMRVCQLIFEQTLGTPDEGYAGQFAGQKSTIGSTFASKSGWTGYESNLGRVIRRVLRRRSSPDDNHKVGVSTDARGEPVRYLTRCARVRIPSGCGPFPVSDSSQPVVFRIGASILYTRFTPNWRGE